ncbi:hypothetical protein [Vibrio sp. Hal054]|uniref:hypothetical protein n=1 Tax=Vibrio sp. Hal054 TaxID=3035158 RepID=UPI00301E232A
MEEEKKQLLEQFVAGCQALNLSMEECVQLAAHNLIGAVSAYGQTYAKVEIPDVGVVEVQC